MNLFSWLLFAALSNAEEVNVALQLRAVAGDTIIDASHRLDETIACKDSDGVPIEWKEDSRMKLDCTHKDFHIWQSNIKRAPTYKPGDYTDDEAWRTVKIQDEHGWQSSRFAGTCVAFVDTNKTSLISCTEWCGFHGLHCRKAMDNAAGMEATLQTWAGDDVASQCSLGEHWEAGKKADIEGYASTHGCDMPLNSQICACAPFLSFG